MHEDYLFFISYARADYDPFLERFHKDLATEVGRRVIHPPQRISFLDREELQAGADWPSHLLEGLQRSRVLVALYSPWFFSRENCGREWALFQMRQDALARRSEGPPPSVILPVLWTPRDALPPELPACAAGIQYDHRRMGSVYAEEGMRELLRLRLYEDQYHIALKYLAARISELAQGPPLPPATGIAAHRDIPNAFAPSSPEPDAPAPAGASAPDGHNGPRYVQFVFVAGRRAEILAENLRERLDFYGDEGGMDWYPFEPDPGKEISRLVGEVTYQQGFVYDRLPLDEHLIRRLEEAQARNKIVVLIVDTWTLRLKGYQIPMQDFDKRQFLNSVVLVPWNRSDPETIRFRGTLETQLQYTFLNRSISRDPNFFIDEIGSPEELKDQLAASLARARMRIIGAADVIRKAQAENGPVRRPVLAGPGRSGA